MDHHYVPQFYTRRWADGSGKVLCYIATHAPIVLAYPGATIYHLDESGITRVDYDQTEHVQLTRDFLNDRDRFLRRLVGGHR